MGGSPVAVLLALCVYAVVRNNAHKYVHSHIHIYTAIYQDEHQFGTLLPFAGYTFTRDALADGEDIQEGTPFIEEKVRSHFKV